MKQRSFHNSVVVKFHLPDTRSLRDNFVVPLQIATLFALLFSATLITSAATFTVTNIANTDDGVCDTHCSLREAIAGANAVATDDIVNFDPPVFANAQTILIGTDIAITANGTLTINGTGSNLLTIDALTLSRVFSIAPNAIVTINGVKLFQGRGRGVGGTPTLKGGAIYNQDGNLTINDVIITDCIGYGDGGAIYNRGNLTINNSTLTNNRSFMPDTASRGDGGAIYNVSGSAVIISGSTISNNSTDISYEGGGIFNEGAVTTTISDSTISANTSWNAGGIFNENGNLQISNSNISNNISNANFGGGGGIQHRGGVLTIYGTTITGNNAPSGGGIMIAGGSGSVSNSSISGNAANNGSGGGISNTVVLSIVNTTISGNSVIAGGNFDGGFGGGILNSGNITVRSSTISSNSAGFIGGGVSTNSIGSFTSGNSIYADNTAVSAVPDFGGTMVSLGYNLIENPFNTTITGMATGNIVGVDPQLVPLRNNGGTTNTVALQPNSPAIDAGDPDNFPATDQRGISRPQDGNLDGIGRTDIGAYERQLATFTVSKAQDTNDGSCDADCSLREAIGAANIASSSDNAIDFNTSVFGSPQTVILSGTELTIASTNTLLIKGPGAALLTISGNNASRIFFVSTGSMVCIGGLTITGGNGIGSLFPQSGGAVFNREASLALKNTIVTNNVTSNVNGFGGGVYNYRGQLQIVNSTISINSSLDGGGIYNSPNGSSLRVVASTISDNAASAGGGLYNWSGANIDGSIIRNNGVGGGIYNVDAVLTINNSIISSNVGAGIYNNSFGSTVNLNSSRIEGNTGSGGIRSLGILNISLSAISNNSTNSDGGGVVSDGTLTMSRSTVSGNIAGHHAGGIKNTGAMTITNSTISRNRSNGNLFGGGGIFNEINGAAVGTLTNVTFAYNFAKDGGGIQNNIGTLQFRNCIIANNTASGSGPDFQGELTSNGYNLVENTTGVTITGNTNGNILGQDPKLDPQLKMNGGPTVTHALRTGSPAIDQGRSTTPALTTDQRALLRPYNFASIPNAAGGNASDIGAFERQAYDVSGVPIFDFDGDGKTDPSVYRPSAGDWYLLNTTTGFRALHFGLPSDIMVPADYTGDGKTDMAVWRPSDSIWYILRSEDNTFYGAGFGANGDIPAPGDYDGDGRVDLVVIRPGASQSFWYLQQSTAGFAVVPFGLEGDVPTLGDYDGDGKNDVAVYRPSVGAWFRFNSSNGSFLGIGFGTTGDKVVPADYTGDGKTDLAVFRPSNNIWYILRSEDNSLTGGAFGASGDLPSPGDYDGDGRADFSVYRPGATPGSQSVFYVQQSTAGFNTIPWGLAEDRPVPGAFVY